MTVPLRVWPLAGEARKVDPSTVGGRSTLFDYMKQVEELSKIPSQLPNPAAIIDPFHNMLLITGYEAHVTLENLGLEMLFMQLTRSYAECRKAASMGRDGYLPHPKRCNFVLLNGPGQTALDVMDLGAHGSTLEGPVQPGIEISDCYFRPTQSPRDLDAVIRAFPSLYSQNIQIKPVQLV